MTENNSFPRIHVTVDLSALRRNARMLRAQLNTPLLFTVKKDAYGHGALQCARVLEEEGAEYLAVYLIDEGLALRERGVKTPILAFAMPDSVEEAQAAIQAGIALTVTSPRTLQIVADGSRQSGKRATVHLKVDTGMGRAGLPAESQQEMIAAINQSPEIYLEGVYSHLADSEDNEVLTRQQAERFTALIGSLGAKPPICHLANSGGALRDCCKADMARIGIALYGGTPLYETEPVMSVFSRISQVRWHEPGETISYGATYKVARQMRTGLIPGGYGDGIIRSLSNAGSVMIDGRLAPIVGRVCMDQVVVDLTAIPDAREGDSVLFFGKMDEHVFPAWKNAEAAGTISYELTTLVGRLATQRSWVDGD